MRKIRLEIILKADLPDIHKGPLGPMNTFLQTFKHELAHALRVPEARLQVLGIRGVFIPLNPAMLQNSSFMKALLRLMPSNVSMVQSDGFSESTRQHKHEDPYLDSIGALDVFFPGASDPGSHMGAGDKDDAGVIIDIEIQPGYLASDLTASDVLHILQDQLQTESSPLMTSNLKIILDGANLKTGAPTVLKKPPRGSADHHVSINSACWLLSMLIASMMVP